jgi:hypothetical protein
MEGVTFAGSGVEEDLRVVSQPFEIGLLIWPKRRTETEEDAEPFWGLFDTLKKDISIE